MISSYVRSNKTYFITFTIYLHYFISRSLSSLCIRELLFFSFRENPQSKSLGAMAKKGRAVVSEKSEMTPLFMDTTCNREGGTSTWEAMYNILEEEQPRILEMKVTVDRRDSSDASMFETTCSFLHRIAARLKIIPYTDMVKWVIDEANISDRELNTRSQEVMGFLDKDDPKIDKFITKVLGLNSQLMHQK